MRVLTFLTAYKEVFKLIAKTQKRSHTFKMPQWRRLENEVCEFYFNITPEALLENRGKSVICGRKNSLKTARIK